MALRKTPHPERSRRTHGRIPSKNVIAAVCVAALACVSAVRAEPVKLRVGWVSATADAPFLLFAQQGVAKHFGVSYTIEPIRFQGSPPVITALATNDLDFGGLGFSALPIAVLNAGL